MHGVDHFTKSATILTISRNGQTQCSFHELGNALAHFVKWAISQLERNIYMLQITDICDLDGYQQVLSS